VSLGDKRHNAPAPRHDVDTGDGFLDGGRCERVPSRTGLLAALAASPVYAAEDSVGFFLYSDTC